MATTEDMTAPQTPEVPTARMVVVYPRGQLTDADRASLRDAGIVAVEADDPSKVVTALPAAPLATPDDLLHSAIGAIAGATLDSVSASFVKRLRDRIEAKAVQP